MVTSEFIAGLGEKMYLLGAKEVVNEDRLKSLELCCEWSPEMVLTYQMCGMHGGK